EQQQHMSMGAMKGQNVRFRALALLFSAAAASCWLPSCCRWVAFAEGLPSSVPSRCFRPVRAVVVARHAARGEEIIDEVMSILKGEMPSYSGEVTADTELAVLEKNSDSLDSLEALMALEDKFNVELEDDEFAKVKTVQELAELIQQTPKGMKLRTVDDETYNAMVRRTHAENRWGELDLLDK
ncbi:unnamed protein product, partial [Polarella glacialis]